MAIEDQLILDLSQAQAQLDDLERQLDALLQPVVIPVDIETDQALTQLQRQIREADTDDITVDVETRELSQAERDIAEMQTELREAVDESERFRREMGRAGDEAQNLGRRGESAFSGLRGQLQGLAVAAAGFIGFREVAQFLNDSIQAASDLEESTSKAQVVFGEFFDEIQAFADTAPQALGLANQEALEFTGTFGNLFTALGLSQGAATDLSQEVVQLGADLASFNNLEVTDALDKLRAGLVGEAEPLRALGVNLNAAAVEAKALELGLAGSTGELDEAAKVQARYALILEQTTTAQGDFARTADGIANRQRTLNAEFQAFQVAVGQALLPVFEDLLDAGQDLLPTITDLAPAFGAATEGVFSVVGALADLIGVLGTVAQGFIDIRDSAAFLSRQDNPIARGIGEIVTALTQAPTTTFFDALEQVESFVTSGFTLDNITAQVIELNEALERGVDPERVLVRVLQGLAEQGTITGDVIAALVSDIQLTAGQAARIRIGAREGLLGDLTPEEIDAITRELERFIDVDARFAGRESGGSRFTQLGDDAEAAIPKIDAFAIALFEAGQTRFQIDISEEIDRLEAQFAELPTAFDGVREALRDEEGEIVDDFGDFADNLVSELQAQLDFVANLNLLREMGFDDLADRFAELGPEYAGILADGLADPAALGRAEDAIDAYERAIDEGLRQATTESVTAAIDSIHDLEDALDSLEDVDITASVFLELTGPGAEFAGSFGTGSLRTSELQAGQTSVPGQTTVNNQTIIFETEPQPTTDTSRIVQASRSIIE